MNRVSPYQYETFPIFRRSVDKAHWGIVTFTTLKPMLIAWGPSEIVYKVSDRVAMKRRVVDCDEGVNLMS